MHARQEPRRQKTFDRTSCLLEGHSTFTLTLAKFQQKTVSYVDDELQKIDQKATMKDHTFAVIFWTGSL